MAIYTIKDLCFSYPENNRQILDNINLTIQEGDFVLLCGKSGSGKTTLLRHLKPTLAPHGEKTGAIHYFDEEISAVDKRVQAAHIGFVSQNPDNQIVTDKVWHELAFGLESLGYDNQTIRLRVAEMASFFGLQTWFMKEVNELSGGQKQLLNLASVMAMQPKVLILDEPTSQLDPIAAAEFLETVKKINLDLGVTVILVEHRLEEVFLLADHIVIMDDGAIVFHDTPTAIGKALQKSQHEFLRYAPTAMRIYAGVAENEFTCPVTIRDGRRFLSQWCLSKGEDYQEVTNIPPPISKKESLITTGKQMFGAIAPTSFGKNKQSEKEYALELDNIYFKYDKKAADILAGLSMQVQKGEIYALLGGNGTGKTTTISVIGGLLKAYRGKVKKNNDKMGILPQNPQSLFVMNKVEKELFHTTKSKEEALEMARFTGIDHLLEQHPYDLSGGEQQRLALCKVLLLEPQILLLDEPTKGLDNEFKEKLGELLLSLKQAGKTILMVSHDVEFCAVYADTCALSFNGSLVSQGSPKEFFSGAGFYTTAANRIARHIWPQAITTEEVIALCNEKENENL